MGAQDLMLESSGAKPTPMQQIAKLKWWIEEREAIRLKKEAGLPKPWTDNKVMQETYFCNVHREDDRVTRFIRATYSDRVRDPMFEVNIGFSRIINEPDTLAEIGYIGEESEFEKVGDTLAARQSRGLRTFGDAYIVSTNGRSMAKAAYVAQVLLPALAEEVGPHVLKPWDLGPPSMQLAYNRYVGIFGISSFMAGQNLADLKNTVGHPLASASDKSTWSCPGPGSLRGLSWIYLGSPDFPRPRHYVEDMRALRHSLYLMNFSVQLDDQDLQNCLCEFDKFMRVTNGTGRSKRRYPGN